MIGRSGSQPRGRRIRSVDAESQPIKVVSHMGAVETERLGRHALIPLNKEERDDSQGFSALAFPLDPVP